MRPSRTFVSYRVRLTVYRGIQIVIGLMATALAIGAMLIIASE